MSFIRSDRGWIDEAEEESPEPGDLSLQERVMLRNLLHFGDQTAGEIAVTRGDIVAVPDTISFDELAATFAEAGHSRLPVYGESLDQVIGMVHIKDVFVVGRDPGRDRSLKAIRYTPLFVPESMRPLLARCALSGCTRNHRRRVRGTEGLGHHQDSEEIAATSKTSMRDCGQSAGDADDGLWEAGAGRASMSWRPCGADSRGEERSR
jgi:hypothetical protein